MSEQAEPIAAWATDPAGAVEKLKSEGYSIYAPGYTADMKTLDSDPVLKGAIEVAFKNRTNEFAQGVEKDVFETSGITKRDGEKYFEYNKRAIAELQNKVKSAPDVKTLTETHQQEVQRLQEEKRTAIGELALRTAINNLPLNVSPESLDFNRELLINKAMAQPYRVEGSQLIFQKLGEDGKTMVDIIDPATTEAYKADAFLSNLFKPMLKAPEQQAQGPGKPPKPGDTTTVIPKNKEELQAHLTNRFRDMGPDYIKEYQRLKVLYAITD